MSARDDGPPLVSEREEHAAAAGACNGRGGGSGSAADATEAPPRAGRPIAILPASSDAVPSFGHRWALELRREDGSVLDQAPLDPDWEPALEWLRLLALRSGRIDAYGAALSVEPVWHETLGAPFLSGFRGRAGSTSYTFPARYFGEAALDASRRLVEAGALSAGERFRYLGVALCSDALEARRPGTDRFRFEEAYEAPALSASGIDDLFARALPRDQPRDEELPVFVPDRVLDDAARLARAAGDVEAGGILLGHLRRDETAGTFHVEVTELVEAPHTRAASDRLTFTADTWSAVRGVIGLRGGGERMVGWAHSHPADHWCRDCPREAQRRCRLASGFLSADDRLLHRTVFPAAWSLALVVTRVAFGDEERALFGWSEGRIERRGYHLLHEAHAARRRAVEDSHA